MGFCQLAPSTAIVILLCSLVISASTRAHAFEPRRGHSSLLVEKHQGILKQTTSPPSSNDNHSPFAHRITKVSQPPVQPPIITVPPPITNTTLPTNSSAAISNSTSNSTVKIELCLDCVDFMNKNLETLIEIITKIGVTDTCEKICGMLNNSVDIDACNAMCDAIGISDFWELFVRPGINPIYACEMVNACTAGTAPAVNLITATINPPAGPPGTVFEFKVSFTVVNETGVGENAFVIYYPVNADHELGFIYQQIFADYTPGDYEASLSFPTNSSFNSGRYLLMFDLCSGACGQDPDPYPFASEEFGFNITNIGTTGVPDY